MHIVRMETFQGRTNSLDRAELGFRAALLIREINARLTAMIAEELADTGLTLPQITLIKALAHGKELTVTELARELSAGKSTVTGIVDRLESAGLVERRRDGEDRREVRVAFTPGSRARVMEIRRAVDGSFARAFARLPDERFAELELSLETILGAIGPADRGAAQGGAEGS
jgi:DNA-binding MarR family transcriptional regulator